MPSLCFYLIHIESEWKRIFEMGKRTRNKTNCCVCWECAIIGRNCNIVMLNVTAVCIYRWYSTHMLYTAYHGAHEDRVQRILKTRKWNRYFMIFEKLGISLSIELNWTEMEWRDKKSWCSSFSAIQLLFFFVKSYKEWNFHIFPLPSA